jgi:hypothetical protein
VRPVHHALRKLAVEQFDYKWRKDVNAFLQRSPRQSLWVGRTLLVGQRTDGSTDVVDSHWMEGTHNEQPEDAIRKRRRRSVDGLSSPLLASPHFYFK